MDRQSANEAKFRRKIAPLFERTGTLGSANDAHEFEQICAKHAHVAPTESYSRGDKIGRLLEITRLQQRVRALENEVSRSRTAPRSSFSRS